MSSGYDVVAIGGDSPGRFDENQRIVTFRDWLLAEAADDTRRLRKLFASR
jgi:hypothetical protein